MRLPRRRHAEAAFTLTELDILTQLPALADALPEPPPRFWRTPFWPESGRADG